MRYLLGVDTSCDDTGVGLVDATSGAVVANVVLRQDDLHAPFGGVVPDRAGRAHLERMDQAYRAALSEANIPADAIAAVAATRGPGLVATLLVGLSWAKGFAWSRGLPFTAVHHLEGHLATVLADAEDAVPLLALVASGGHTHLFELRAGRPPTLLGATLDDAAGEAFDKVARLLGLPFPGGPALASLAERGDPERYRFTPPLKGRAGYDFSFSGLKTAVATLLEREPDADRADVAASFQRTAVQALASTLTRAARDRGIDTVAVVGGVAANRALRTVLDASGLHVRVPPASLATDNGAMIALAAYLRSQPGGPDLAAGAPAPSDPFMADAEPYLPLAARQADETP